MWDFLLRLEKEIKYVPAFGKYWRRALERKRYKKIHASSQFIQRWFRSWKKRRTDFSATKFEKLRPVKIIFIQTTFHWSRSKMRPIRLVCRPQHAVSYYIMIIAVVDMDQGIIVQKWNSSLRCGKLLTSVKGDQPFMSTHLHTEHMLAGVSGKHTVVLSLMQIGINKSNIILPWTSQD